MKNIKILVAMILSTLMIAGGTVFAANEECTEFSPVGSNWGTAHSTCFLGTNGGITFHYGNTPVYSLPYGMVDLGNIYSFCFYNGRIYYLTAPMASDVVLGSIYSCDMNGQNNVLIANNASNYSNVCIVDNVLYYDSYETNGWNPESPKGYSGGIYKINLGNCSWQKLVTNGNATMTYCDGDYLYFSIYNDYGMSYYAIDTNGAYCVRMSGNSDEFQTVYGYKIRGNNTYYIDDGVLYCRMRNGNDWNRTKLCNVYGDISQIADITNSYVYYITVNSKNLTAYVYRINRNN